VNVRAKQARDFPLERLKVVLGAESVAPILDLCLSGGGYRAAAFHSGAVLRLAELGLLERRVRISSVSGGSIYAGLLASKITPGSEMLDIETVKRANAALTELAQQPVRLRKIGDSTLAARLGPVFGHALLSSLPVWPDFSFRATDIAAETHWVFERARIGSSARGFFKPGDTSVATAVAASAAFPGVFREQRFSLVGLTRLPTEFDRSARHGALSKKLVRLSDGGLVDNAALRDVMRPGAIALVSNGAKPPNLGSYGSIRHPFRLIRFWIHRSSNSLNSEFVLKLVEARLHLRQKGQRLPGEVRGAIWSVTTVPKAYHRLAPAPYSDLTIERIGAFRTDLNRFAPSEIAILSNHGYINANAALTRLVRGGVLPGFTVPFPAQDNQFVETYLSDGLLQRLGHGLSSTARKLTARLRGDSIRVQRFSVHERRRPNGRSAGHGQR
jgi:NTE family protein